eukprot:evm.model.scf_654.1 EVM.evm.TU.scf_654.1   scf_654:5501-12658(+)
MNLAKSVWKCMATSSNPTCYFQSVAVCGLEALKTANELEAKGTIVRRPLIPAFKVFGQESLLTLNGSDHSRVRKLLHPAFSKERVESYIPYIVETAKEACAKLSGLGCFSMTEEIRKYAFKVSTSSFLGMEFQSRSSDEVLQILEEMANGIYTLGIDLPFTKFGKAMRHRAELLDIVNESILAMKRSQPEGGRTNKALQQILDARDEDGNGLDMAIIVNTIILMLYGGYDTVSTTMDTIFHALALDPQIWDKLREEQRQVVESFGDDITAESLASMPFAEVVVKEGLRTNPVAPFTFKFAEESFELGGYHIPAGWKVLVGAGFTMRYMDGRWRDADAFRPERFLEPGADRLDTFLAFGMGAHMCLGKELALTELRVMLAVLARGYEVRLQNPHARMMAMPIPHLEDGCMATVRRLQASGP